MGKIFFNSSGDFQWASVAALFALIGTIVSAIFSSLSHNNSKKTMVIQKEMNQQKIDADIISKSRMHWMDNAKIITSDFITIALNLGANFKMFKEKVIQFNNISSRIVFLEKKGNSHLSKIEKEEYTELKNGINLLNNEMQTRVNTINTLLESLAKNFLLIKLNFTKNVEHQNILDSAEKIYNRLRKHSLNDGWIQFGTDKELKKSLQNTNLIFKENSEDTEILTTELSNYFKKEWEKVKQGK